MQRPKLTFPDDVAKYVTEAYERHDSILEYGSGGSTVLASEMDGKHLVSVESDAQWAQNLNAFLDQSDAVRSRPRVRHIDVGETGAWGRPVNHDKHHLFPWYALAPWVMQSEREPLTSLVLVDGRFRPACFLASMAMGRGALELIFDDYLERPNYHFIEEYLRPEQIIGRAAVFIRDPEIDWGEIALRHQDAFYDVN
mgnify:FL=1